MIDLLIGITGMALLLCGFLMNLLRKVSHRNYLLLNFFGSAAMIAYSLMLSSIPFLILNIVWTGAAAIELLRR